MSQVRLESSPLVLDQAEMSEVTPESSQAELDLPEDSVPAWVYPYKVGVTGGALGGLVMVAVAIMYGIFSGRGVWLPVNLIGATLVRDLQGASIETLSQFSSAALVAGLLLHAAISVGLGFVFAVLLPTMPGPPMIWSLTVGPLLWSIASLLVLPALNPVMAEHVEEGSFFVAHVVYGIVLGWWIPRTPKIHAE